MNNYVNNNNYYYVNNYVNNNKKQQNVMDFVCSNDKEVIQKPLNTAKIILPARKQPSPDGRFDHFIEWCNSSHHMTHPNMA